MRINALALLLIVLAPCATASPPRVIVSVRPLHALTVSVMEGVGSPGLLIGEHRSPHEFLLKPSSARAIQKADLVVWVGPALESQLAASFKSLADNHRLLTLIDTKLPTLLAARDGHPGEADEPTGSRSVDPHAWLDPDNAAAMAITIAERLKKLDPANVERYETNTRKLLEAIHRTDRQLADRLKPYADERYLTLHDSYQYFEHHYGLTSAGGLGGDNHHGAGAKRIAALRERLAGGKIACILYDPLASRRLVDVLREDNDTPAVAADPLGWQAGETSDYTSLLEAVAEGFETCFDGAESPG